MRLMKRLSVLVMLLVVLLGCANPVAPPQAMMVPTASPTVTRSPAAAPTADPTGGPMAPPTATDSVLGNDTSAEDQMVEDALQAVVIEDQITDGPSGCSSLAVARVLLRFLLAFNRGEQERLARFFLLDSP